MKKRILACLLGLCLLLCACTPANNTSSENYAIEYQSNVLSYLLDGYAPVNAKAGSTVTLRTGVFYDADFFLYCNGIAMEQTHADSDYWEYQFTMPTEDVTITYEIRDGFLVDPMLSDFEHWLRTVEPSQISQVKTRFAPDGVVPGTLAEVLVTTNEQTIDQFFTACQNIILTHVSGTDAIAPPGSAKTTITFSLKNGQEHTLSFAGQLYYNGSFTFRLSNLPSLKNGQEVELRHGFISYGENAKIYRNGDLIDQTFGIDELEFVPCNAPDGEPTYSGLFYAIETSFGRLSFVTSSIFYFTTEDTTQWYELCECTINSFLYSTTVPTD